MIVDRLPVNPGDASLMALAATTIATLGGSTYTFNASVLVPAQAGTLYLFDTGSLELSVGRDVFAAAAAASGGSVPVFNVEWAGAARGTVYYFPPIPTPTIGVFPIRAWAYAPLGGAVSPIVARYRGTLMQVPEMGGSPPASISAILGVNVFEVRNSEYIQKFLADRGWPAI